jgi:hypothetical protein
VNGGRKWRWTMDTDKMDMPTQCDKCGDWFDLNDGKPCHRCHIVFCPECARYDDEDGWICVKCKQKSGPAGSSSVT